MFCSVIRTSKKASFIQVRSMFRILWFKEDFVLSFIQDTETSKNKLRLRTVPDKEMEWNQNCTIERQFSCVGLIECIVYSKENWVSTLLESYSVTEANEHRSGADCVAFLLPIGVYNRVGTSVGHLSIHSCFLANCRLLDVRLLLRISTICMRV